MRYMIKGDGGLPSDELPKPGKSRRLRRVWRRIVAFTLLAGVGLLAYEYSGPAVDPEYVTPQFSESGGRGASVLSWIRLKTSAASSNVRAFYDDVVPSGPLAILIKLALCGAAAAIFIGGPRRV